MPRPRRPRRHAPRWRRPEPMGRGGPSAGARRGQGRVGVRGGEQPAVARVGLVAVHHPPHRPPRPPPPLLLQGHGERPGDAPRPPPSPTPYGPGSFQALCPVRRCPCRPETRPRSCRLPLSLAQSLRPHRAARRAPAAPSPGTCGAVGRAPHTSESRRRRAARIPGRQAARSACVTPRRRGPRPAVPRPPRAPASATVSRPTSAKAVPSPEVVPARPQGELRRRRPPYCLILRCVCWRGGAGRGGAGGGGFQDVSGRKPDPLLVYVCVFSSMSVSSRLCLCRCLCRCLRLQDVSVRKLHGLKFALIIFLTAHWVSRGPPRAIRVGPASRQTCARSRRSARPRAPASIDSSVSGVTLLGLGRVRPGPGGFKTSAA